MQLPKQPQPANILLIEDNAGDIGLVVEALKRNDVACEISVISDGEHAVRHIDQIEAGEEPCPELVILDLNLPRKPGIEVLKRIRASGVCSRVPIVVLTSSDNQKDKDSVAVFRPVSYFQKPARLAEFMALGAEFKSALTAPKSF